MTNQKMCSREISRQSGYGPIYKQHLVVFIDGQNSVALRQSASNEKLWFCETSFDRLGSIAAETEDEAVKQAEEYVEDLALNILDVGRCKACASWSCGRCELDDILKSEDCFCSEFERKEVK